MPWIKGTEVTSVTVLRFLTCVTLGTESEAIGTSTITWELFRMQCPGNLPKLAHIKSSIIKRAIGKFDKD